MDRLQVRRTAQAAVRGFFALCSALVLVVTAAVPVAYAVDPPTGDIISKDSNGEAQKGQAFHPVVSADGSIIAFTSTARLTASAPFGRNTAYVYDMRTQRFIWNTPRQGSPFDPSGGFVNDISADGRLLLLTSEGDLAGDGHGAGLFVRNLETGVTVRVSVDASGAALANGGDADASLSANGRYVVFAIYMTGGRYLWVYDTTTNTAVNVPPDGYSPYTAAPTISDDGRYIAYQSYDDNPVQVYDRTLGQTILAPTTAHGDAPGPHRVSIAPDGSSVVYEGVPTYFDGQEANNGPGVHVFRMTIPDGTITDLTPTTDINAFSSARGGFSPDGQYVTLASQLPLTGSTVPYEWHVFSYHIPTGTYQLVGASSNDTYNVTASGEADISNGGDVVAYLAENIAGPEDYRSNIYVRTFNGWTPPAATWTPTPASWDNTAPDMTPPVLTVDIDQSQWYQGPHTVNFTCEDPGHGTLTPPDPQTFNTEYHHFFSASCTDAEGNTTTHQWVIAIDMSGPKIEDAWRQADTPAGTVFSSSLVVRDEASGVAAATCTIADGTLLAPGTYSVACDAVDIVGNASSATVTLTISPWKQASMSAGVAGVRKRNTTGNDRSAILLNYPVKWGNTVVITANIGSADGAVHCHDARGNNYAKIIDRLTATGRLVACAAPVTTALEAGDRVVMTYPAFDGPSVAAAVTLDGLDTPGTPLDKSSRIGVGTATTSGKVFPAESTRHLVFGAVAYDGPGTLEAVGNVYQWGEPLYAGNGSARRNLMLVIRHVTGPAEPFYRVEGTLSTSTSWQSFMTIWNGQNSGPDPA